MMFPQSVRHHNSRVLRKCLTAPEGVKTHETPIMAVNGFVPYLKCGHFASRDSTSERIFGG